MDAIGFVTGLHLLSITDLPSLAGTEATSLEDAVVVVTQVTYVLVARIVGPLPADCRYRRMNFPDEAKVDSVLNGATFPDFARISYTPETPELDRVEATARVELDALSLDDLPTGAQIGVGVGSRGIHDIVPITTAVVDELQSRGFDPVVLPAMGSHGGATAEGQRHTLEGIGITEDVIGCPIDARMETVKLGESEIGHEVWFAKAALELDGVLAINRVKAHTNFFGPIESGLCKMIAVGLAKQDGASATHDAALVDGYVETITAAIDVIREEAPVLGGIAIVENFHDHTAHIEGIPIEELPEAEKPLLEKAYEYMPTLPYDELDVLVVDEIGKDISGAGMDTNVTGRYELLNTTDQNPPAIKRIVVCGLTEATHGNGHGIGSADLTTEAVADELDLAQMYTNALTSGSLSKARVPMALPTQRQAITAAVETIGTYTPESLRMAWIQDTAHLSSFRISEALVDEEHEAITVDEWQELAFEDGAPTFDPISR